jgi:hypothetical protein
MAPGMSKALLAQRLKLLEAEGILLTEPRLDHRGSTYSLTRKGAELKAITDAMGSWGARWLELDARDVGPAYVLWATCRLVDPDRLPDGGLVVRVELADAPTTPVWLLLQRPQPEVCSSYPGRPEDLVVRTDSETLARWHLRHISFGQATRSGRLRIDGPKRDRTAFAGCLRPSPFAGVERIASASRGTSTLPPERDDATPGA